MKRRRCCFASLEHEADCACIDTIDLQDPDTPSAKDHTRQPTNPNALGDGPPAPHQAATLKSSGLEGVELHSRSPRASQDLSSKELQLLHEHVDGDEVESADGEGVAGSRGTAGEEGDEDEDGDEGLDDDMMDKISSSPSIDDGGYNLARDSSALLFPSPAASDHSHHSSACSSGSSPYIATPEHLPLSFVKREEPSPSGARLHHSSRYALGQGDVSVEVDGPSRSPGHLKEQISCETIADDFKSCYEDLESALGEDADFEDTVQNLAMPMSDELLDNSLDSGARAPRFGPEDMENQLLDNNFDLGIHSTEPGNTETDALQEKTEYWEYEEAWPRQRPPSRSSLELYYEDESSSDEDADTDDLSFDDPRFTDSGWGATSLRDIEDIDFEFVYALHTFVATVEGQANATKGDTMVLLDDSNSYWWLVRVVKDNSIGMISSRSFSLSHLTFQAIFLLSTSKRPPNVLPA